VKVALVTTTINVPTVLALYRRLDPSVEFFVAKDLKTPAGAIGFCASLPNCHVIEGDEWACSELIGWNTCGRRNIAFLEALKWGADVVVTVNDDDIPMDESYFFNFKRLFPGEAFGGIAEIIWKRSDWNGIEVSSQTGWFDPGSLLIPPVRHRGFPITHQSSLHCAPITDAKVGVAVGLLTGMPDVDATTRIENPSLRVHQTSKLLDTGVVVAPSTRTVFNSENTALLREFVPAFFHMPGVGRHDDILASLVVQRVMRDRGYRVHLGQPYCWQERNPHSLLSDLKAEMWGVEHVDEFARWLDGLDLSGPGKPIDAVRLIYWMMGDLAWMPPIVREAGLAWIKDCEGVL
jgi:hypothetical protein